jgi:hypothetical protein
LLVGRCFGLIQFHHIHGSTAPSLPSHSQESIRAVSFYHLQKHTHNKERDELSLC